MPWPRRANRATCGRSDGEGGIQPSPVDAARGRLVVRPPGVVLLTCLPPSYIVSGGCGFEHIARADDAGGVPGRGERRRQRTCSSPAGAVSGGDHTRFNELTEVSDGWNDPILDGCSGEVVAAEEGVDRLVG